MAATDECTLKIIGRFQNQNIVNTMHYIVKTDATGDLTILQNLCEAFDTAIKTAWLACHLDTYTLVGLKAFGKTGTSKTPGVLIVGDAGVVVAEDRKSVV